MKLNVPLIRQAENSSDCGLACLAMLLAHHNVDIDLTQLKKEIKVYAGTGTYAPQLGKYLLDHGFEVEIVSMNPHLLTRSDRKKSQAALLASLTECRSHPRTKQSRRPLQFFLAFMQAGGKLTARIPSVADIEGEIGAGRPLVALLTSCFLLSSQPRFNFHFNAVTGIDDRYVYVNDPGSDSDGGKQKYPIADFMYAIHASAHGDLDNASLMKIRKRK